MSGSSSSAVAVRPSPSLPEVLELAPRVFGDERGFFVESFNARTFAAAIGREVTFVQDNHSRSARGVLRGLHYQLDPAQAKLVRVASGRIFDVAVDVRRGSPTFGRWTGIELDAVEQRQLWIPEGYAHGFLVLSDVADVLYKASAYYAPETERTIRYDDPAIGVEWPLASEPVLSARDRGAMPLARATVFE